MTQQEISIGMRVSHKPRPSLLGTVEKCDAPRLRGFVFVLWDEDVLEAYPRAVLDETGRLREWVALEQIEPIPPYDLEAALRERAHVHRHSCQQCGTRVWCALPLDNGCLCQQDNRAECAKCIDREVLR